MPATGWHSGRVKPFVTAFASGSRRKNLPAMDLTVAEARRWAGLWVHHPVPSPEVATPRPPLFQTEHLEPPSCSRLFVGTTSPRRADLWLTDPWTGCCWLTQSLTEMTFSRYDKFLRVDLRSWNGFNPDGGSVGIAGDLIGGFLLSQNPAAPDDRGSMPKRSPLTCGGVLDRSCLRGSAGSPRRHCSRK
jgi:hypothetical protein